MASPRGIRRMAQVQPIRTGNATADRATEEVAGRVNELTRNPLAQAVALAADLQWGLNKVNHGLKVPVRHFIPAAGTDPTAVITSRQAENPVPDKQVWVQLDGPAAATALLFLLPVVT